jgi:tripartite-type tricarboxylate transporter receptor subunit TctC
LAACAAGFVIGMSLSVDASAQNFPTQPVKIVVPFSAGSATDILARAISDKLADRLGQNVIIENRPGLPGTTTVAKSAPDGYTLMLTSNGHTIAGIINKALSFDPVRDFAGITPVANVPLAVIVPPDSPVKTIKDLITQAKENPGKLNFASPGLGSSTFIAAALFKDAAGIDIVHVPYKGSPESITSVVRGDTQMYFAPINVATELVVAGKVRAIAVATAERVPTLKDVPTISESGVPGFKYDAWFGIMAPAGTPKPIISRLNKEIVEILRMTDVIERLAGTGAVPLTSSPEEFDKVIADDTTKLAQMFKLGIN